MSRTVCLIALISFPIRKAPVAAPTIIIISKGSECRMIPSLPPAAM